MNKKNYWCNVIEASMVEEPIQMVFYEEMAIAIKAMKPGKAAGLSEVRAEMIFAIGDVRFNVMAELC